MACRRRAYRISRRAELTGRTCAREDCGLVFLARSSGQKYCTATCRKLAAPRTRAMAPTFPPALDSDATDRDRPPVAFFMDGRSQPGPHHGGEGDRGILPAPRRRGHPDAPPGDGRRLEARAASVHRHSEHCGVTTAPCDADIHLPTTAASPALSRRTAPVSGERRALRADAATAAIHRIGSSRLGGAVRAVGRRAAGRWSRTPRLVRIPAVGLAGTTVLLSLVVWIAIAGNLDVNDTSDSPDANPGDGECLTYEGTCTLRAAIMEANASPGSNTIYVPEGIYELEIPTLNEDLPDTGDFDITATVTIQGVDTDGDGAIETIIDGGFPPEGSPLEQLGMDRLIEIHPSAPSVTLSRLVLREGFSPEEGGGLQSWSPGTVRLLNVHVDRNFASKTGGGINLADPEGYPWVNAPLPMPPGGRIEIVDSRLTAQRLGRRRRRGQQPGLRHDLHQPQRRRGQPGAHDPGPGVRPRSARLPAGADPAHPRPGRVRARLEPHRQPGRVRPASAPSTSPTRSSATTSPATTAPASRTPGTAT